MSNYFEQEATLDTAVRDTTVDLLKEVHTCLPATVTEVDLDNQLLTIELGVKRILVNGIEVTVPPIAQVPLCTLRAGGFLITFPVAEGDQGAAFFSEREITQWMLAGDQGPQTPRQIHMHSYSDAFFLPALASTARKIPNFNKTGLQIRTLDSMVTQTFNNNSIVSKVGGVTMTLDNTGLHVQNGTITTNMDIKGGANPISLTTHEHTSGSSGSPTSPPIPE